MKSNTVMRADEKTALDAVVAGYLGVDIAPGFPSARKSVPASELFRPGKLIETEGLGISLGGVVANTGLAMKRFGLRVNLMGCVGNDDLGDVVMDRLREQGVTSGIRRIRRAGTAYGIVLAPPGLDRIFFEDPGCNGVMTSADIDYQTVSRCRLFHFGYPPLMRRMWANTGEELRKLFRRVHKLGAVTSLDMSLPDPDGPAGKADWQGILAAALPYVDMFVPSIEELLFMLEPESYAQLLSKADGRDMADVIPQADFERLAERTLTLGVKVLMIKAGHRGAYIRTGDTETLNAKMFNTNWSRRKLWVEAYPVDASRFKNACGAGDCAVAGFLTALLNGLEIEKAARYAMLAGRDNLYGMDACSGLTDWGIMTALIDMRALELKKRVRMRSSR